MIDWSNVEDALHKWLETALGPVGVAPARILWSDQDLARGEGTVVLVRRDSLTPVGPPRFSTIDHAEDEPAPDAGEEIEQRTEQTVALTVSLQAFDPRKVGDLTGTALLHEAIMGLSQPSIRDALQAAGLFLFERTAVRNVTVLVGADMESRAIAEARFYLNDSRSEFTGYIASVELTQNVDGVDMPTQTLTVSEE